MSRFQSPRTDVSRLSGRPAVSNGVPAEWRSPVGGRSASARETAFLIQCGGIRPMLREMGRSNPDPFQDGRGVRPPGRAGSEVQGRSPALELRRDNVHPRPGPRHPGHGLAHNRRALGSLRGELAGCCEEVSQHSDWSRLQRNPVQTLICRLDPPPQTVRARSLMVHLSRLTRQTRCNISDRSARVRKPLR